MTRDTNNTNKPSDSLQDPNRPRRRITRLLPNNLVDNSLLVLIGGQASSSGTDTERNDSTRVYSGQVVEAAVPFTGRESTGAATSTSVRCRVHFSSRSDEQMRRNLIAILTEACELVDAVLSEDDDNDSDVDPAGN
jgi:hypothetical protein